MKIVQKHHIIYAHPDKKSQKDEVVSLYKGEHLILTRIQWLGHISKGFIKSLKVFIALNEDKAEDLDEKN